MRKDKVDVLGHGGILHLLLGAPRRHPRLGTFVAILTLAASIAGAILMPRKYVAESRIIAQRNQVIPNLGNPSRAIPSSADGPNRGAEETILTQENLIAIAKDVNLMDLWPSSRSGIMWVKDTARRHGLGRAVLQIATATLGARTRRHQEVLHATSALGRATARGLDERPFSICPPLRRGIRSHHPVV